MAVGRGRPLLTTQLWGPNSLRRAQFRAVRLPFDLTSESERYHDTHTDEHNLIIFKLIYSNRSTYICITFTSSFPTYDNAAVEP